MTATRCCERAIPHGWMDTINTGSPDALQGFYPSSHRILSRIMITRIWLHLFMQHKKISQLSYVSQRERADEEMIA